MILKLFSPKKEFNKHFPISCQCQMSISTDSPVSFMSESWRRKLSMVHHNKISDVVVLWLRKTFSEMHLDYWLLGPAANSHSKFRQCLLPEKPTPNSQLTFHRRFTHWFSVLIIDICAYLLKTYFWWTMKYNKYENYTTWKSGTQLWNRMH
jgi:hypothetical protein